MQPRNPYQGQPTSNMVFPTEAYMAAAADAAKTQADAQAKLGAQIGQVISSVAGAYAGYKQQQSQAKSYETFLKNPVGQKMLGIDASAAEGYIKAAKEMGGAREQIQFYQMGVAPMMQSNMGLQQQLKLIDARAGAEAGLIGQRQANEVLNQATDFTNKQKAYTFQTDEQIRLEKEKSKLKSTSGSGLYNPSVVEKPN